MGLIIGGRYEVIKPLSQGAFGQTFLAQDNHRPGNPTCVVKQLIPQVVNELTLKLFNTEAKALEKLGTHPQIPTFYASFQENQSFYLVQEFVDGHDLSHEIGYGKKQSEAYVIALLKDILEILVFVHGYQIVHRDLKPRNIIRRIDGRLILIDFGGVKQISTQQYQGRQNSISVGIGTPGYMPSEQAHHKPRLSSDIYAIGMIAIQALTGIKPVQLPEDGQTGEVVWRNAVNVSDELAKIIETMTRYDWRQRYPSAVEALEAIQQMQEKIQVLSSTLSTEDLFYQGNGFLQAGKLTEAVDCYKQVLLKKPDFANAWYNRGIALEELARHAEALTSFKQVIQLQSENTEAWYHHGIALRHLQRYTDAIHSFEKTIALQERHSDAWYQKGLTLGQLERHAEAISAFDRSLDCQLQAKTWLAKGDIWRELQRYSEAIACYNKALQLEPHSAEAWYQRGCAFFKLRRFSEAMVSFNRALQYQPDHSLAFQTRNLLISQMRL
jgi:serine/threonine protein kinase